MTERMDPLVDPLVKPEEEDNRIWTRMMRNVYFAIGLHFHQPVGNFEEILEGAYQNCYKPFLEVFSRYPDIKMTFHFSGNLLDYFEDKHPEFLDKVSELSGRGQIEIMGGGYYEPVFQAIPGKDRIGQIEMLSRYCRKRFGAAPRGMWMPERVWSPELTADFRNCGMKYSILDDTHLIRAGVSRDELRGYFITGGYNSKLAIFPTDKTLRYMIPFKSPRQTIRYFKKIAKREDDPLFVYGDDGEKFGEWPWTHGWVYKKGWLNNFFKELMKNRKWVKTVTFSEYLSTHLPLKEVHIPEGSYSEMLEWSGGSWMNFLTKYPESNQMHKRMSYVSNRISKLEDKEHTAISGNILEEARRELYKGQCNCVYWHGVFGGIYLHHLRNAAYEHLINAGRAGDAVEYEQDEGWMNVKEVDFYNRSEKAVILEDKNFFICVDPLHGGTIRELDYKTKSVNLINTLARHEEPYHKKILHKADTKVTDPIAIYESMKSVDERIKKGIFYDKYPRACLVEHFINKDLERDDFQNCNYTEPGNSFSAPYEVRIEKRSVICSRETSLEDSHVVITKEIGISSDTEVEILYNLKNNGPAEVDTFFGTEFNMSLPYADSERYTYEADAKKLGGMNESGSASKSASFSIRNSQGDLGIELDFPQHPEKIWYFPVMTVSQSERSYDVNYQASCIFPIWSVKLMNGESTRFSIKWRMKIL